ncbi:MAG: adenylyltransferase/cytidyltransferase family protein [Ardenticatenaceae bacterium]|nr:adenylyltransferase/cytidyltransferase family protein [Ardenticatenaceae bacterium]
MNRVFTLEAALAARNEARLAGRRLVFTNGIFDVLHVGHLDYLERAAVLGDLLWVGLNDDASVRTLKGPQRPLVPWADRARLLAALRPVDAVIGFSERRADRLIERLAPDVYVKGGDYTPDTLPEAPTAARVGAEVVILPFLPGHSTSELIATILARYCKPADKPASA